MTPFRKLLDDLLAERGQIIGIPARHQAFVGDHFLVDHVRAGDYGLAWGASTS